METSLHSFIDIFDTKFKNNGETVALSKIIIPKIQRDYAQGRPGREVERVRTRFLEALYGAIAGEPIILDFVYGDINAEGVMTPLDGQQRLTTLFLLHWYAARKDKADAADYAFLRRFSYDTRYCARDFCTKLIDDYNPSFERKLSEEIVDQNWFPLDWGNDPTISSMITMIDAIDERFKDVTNLWASLVEGKIKFYFLPIKDMGLTDELYIKMNSRGKPLTLFEHFKAELERVLNEQGRDVAKRIIGKIDIDWTDMLWRYRGDDNLTDDEFLRYFRFVCDIIGYKCGDNLQGNEWDEFDLIKKYFKGERASENIKLLEMYFDCWCRLEKESSGGIAGFFERNIARTHTPGKITMESRYNTDVFEDCLRCYGDKQGNGNRLFPLNRLVLLYAFITYLLNADSISEKHFGRRLRIVNNLVRNSEDQISDSENRSSGNRMPYILQQVESIILDEKIDDTLSLSLNKFQLTEEKEKARWLMQNPDLAEMLFDIEDHELLFGQISILGLEDISYFGRFKSLFMCDYDLVDCALLSIGDYSQCEVKRRQLGSTKSSSWISLFHAARADNSNTKTILKTLLGKTESFTNENDYPQLYH